MKKTWLVLFMVIASTFLLSACSLFGGGEDEIVFESNVQEKRVGVLKSLGGMSVGEGTHILELEDKSTMRLKSSNIDLNNSKYLSQRVEVRGPVAKTTDGKDIMDVKSIDLAEEEEEQAAAEGVEKDYTNAGLGISLKYIDSWKIEEESDRIMFTAPEQKQEESEDEATAEETAINDEDTKQDIVIIERMPNPQKKTLEMFLQLPDDSTKLMTLGYAQTLVGIDQLEGLKKEANNRYEIDIWLTRGEYVYQLTFIGSENPKVADNRNTYFSMVSSFKFIGILEEEEEEVSDKAAEDDASVEDDTAAENETAEEDTTTETIKTGYSSFESAPYKFTAQYPSGWYFSGASGSEDGVLHHYGFGDEPLDEGGEELVSLDIVSGSLPSGTSVSVGGNTGVKVYENGEVALYITRSSGTVYKIHGDKTYESKIIDMASGIKPLDQ